MSKQYEDQPVLDKVYPPIKREGPVECLGMEFENDEARREYFLNILREKLKDSEFRKIEGFPIGEDEDILALSDPPYYTACPNPFIEDFIKYYGKPYNPDETYSHEPFALDVSEGKNDKLYRLHSYHTKVPPDAIVPMIEHYTEPGDIIIDAFSGSGMTGIASRKLGQSAILCDLAPGATFISHHYNSIPLSSEIQSSLETLIRHVRQSCSWMFEVKHNELQTGVLNYAILSEVFFCPHCSSEVAYSDIVENSQCPFCDASLKKGDMQRKYNSNGKTELRLVRINYKVGRARHERPPTEGDLELFSRIEQMEIPHWYPRDRMMNCPPPWGDYYRSGYHKGYERVSDFYTKRNLWAIACMWEAIDRLSLPPFLRFVVTSLLAMRCSLRMPYRAGGRSAGAINNLHIPSLIQEYNPIEVLVRKGKAFVDAALYAPREGKAWVTTQSSANLRQIKDCSIDYAFLDPPFGSNIIYSELNFLWEAWFRVFSNRDQEAIVSDSQEKGFKDYENLMYLCFKEMNRILKPGRWITIEFHNSKNSIWTAIQESLAAAGFVVADVRTLDKRQGSYKQVSTLGAVKQDLIISAYRPNSALEERFKLEAGTEGGVWDFVRNHLRQLPVFVSKGGQAEVIAERQNFLLFDRMVAFHVQRGVTVPLSAAEFYAGLAQKFPERDGMYFLPEQIAEYDRKRMSVKELMQLELFVLDEETAIQWLRQQLTKKPQTFQDIHPQFLRERGWKRHEKPCSISIVS
jgi:DNA modification methylase